MESNDFAQNKDESVSPASQSSHLERLHTAGGHINDRSQPALPVVHRNFASPSPLGLISFATGDSSLPVRCDVTNEIDIFLISMYGLHARGVQSSNAMIGCLVFFGGVCQFIAGIMEFITGNTVSLNNLSEMVN